MKIVSWNVNGIRAVMKKDFMKFFNESDADVYCIQETKIHDGDIPEDLRHIGALKGYVSYWNGAEKKGYSGVLTISKVKPLSVEYGIGSEKYDSEGRSVTLEFEDFYLINVYVLNSGRGVPRLSERMEYNKLFIDYCEKLRKNKPVVFCGDLNVAHKEIDLKNPSSNKKNAGFTPEEREAFDRQLEKGYVDTFRMFNSEPDNYTWWSYMFNSRAKNVGWRIDYFVASEEIRDRVKSSEILANVMGSDHCPIVLELKK